MFYGTEFIIIGKVNPKVYIVDNNYSWWMETGLDKTSFARDRLVEHYFWCSGMVPGPEYSAFREMGTKVICLLIIIDDLYDIYGSLEELELFTDFIDR